MALVAGSLVYCVLAIVAARRYQQASRRLPRVPAGALPSLSVLKPLAGAEDELEANLRTFFTQDYPRFELLFAVRSPQDAAIPVVDRLRAAYPQVPARLILTGEPPYPNAKVYSLDRMMQAARHDLLVMSDSDIRVSPEFLRTAAAEFADPRVGLSTCPYRAVPGRSFWSVLEAIMMNTEFLAGVLTARMLEGMKFALGPTITARREVLQQMGGFGRLQEYLAEDFVMGQKAAENGHTVVLSSYVIEHHIGSHGFAANARHRLRWCRSTRRSRPAGYIGQVFTNPLPLALLLWAFHPAWWPMLLATVFVRTMLAYTVAEGILHDPLCRSRWWLIPVQDVVSFAFWMAGFFGDTILWRGRRYRVYADGRFKPA